ncbi:soluble lytic murein transglycosylase [Pseudomonas sp. ok272]|uniref:transglycosylase SLT domain-containing protein n=1 Tax=unclassified Pseudomonas TaxID=196821 RepID=UPI0008CC069D|nr:MULTISPECIES: transglycosylase SLT domain-containing protein [unclassified Pseudomonas]SEM62841.1 soluble lytic murein transglycosylase [Pseudomonas sp. ok272]SFM47291.1 soluble lytic murein transglycosylase [Pseudomonas sp. ok602]
MSIVSLTQQFNSHRGAADGVGSAQRTELTAAAEQFEALFLQQILKQMRKASDVLAADNPMRSRELDTMRDFYDEILAETLAGKKQTGIANLLVQQLSGDAGQSQSLEQAGALARGAELPTRTASLSEPLRGTWQRGIDSLNSTWQRGTAGFSALVDRVIQHESSGRVDAVSSKGALGLMQLMPGTARDMAAELGVPFSEERLTRDAGYNKQLGSAYLNKMLSRYDGEPALAIAAYNAGPGRVDEWLQQHGDPRSGEISVTAWIKRIPFQETRDYTHNIMGVQRAATPKAAPLEQPLSMRPAQPLTQPWSTATQMQVEAAASAKQGLIIGSAASKQLVGQTPSDAMGGEQPVASEVLGFKSATDSVALPQRTANSGGQTPHQSHSAAFAQVIRIERKEIES